MIHGGRIANVLVGVGAGQKPQKWLVPGTQVDVQISKIGTLRNTVEYAKAPDAEMPSLST